MGALGVLNLRIILVCVQVLSPEIDARLNEKRAGVVTGPFSESLVNKS
jgi:hypothetical protein